MIQMKDTAFPVIVFIDDNDFFIWGIHFFNKDKRSKEFSDDMDSLFGVGTLRKTTLEDLPLAADSPMDNPENSVNG